MQSDQKAIQSPEKAKRSLLEFCSQENTGYELTRKYVQLQDKFAHQFSKYDKLSPNALLQSISYFNKDFHPQMFLTEYQPKHLEMFVQIQQKQKILNLDAPYLKKIKFPTFLEYIYQQKDTDLKQQLQIKAYDFKQEKSKHSVDERKSTTISKENNIQKSQQIGIKRVKNERISDSIQIVTENKDVSKQQKSEQSQNSLKKKQKLNESSFQKLTQSQEKLRKSLKEIESKSNSKELSEKSKNQQENQNIKRENTTKESNQIQNIKTQNIEIQKTESCSQSSMKSIQINTNQIKLENFQQIKISEQQIRDEINHKQEIQTIVQKLEKIYKDIQCFKNEPFTIQKDCISVNNLCINKIEQIRKISKYVFEIQENKNLNTREEIYKISKICIKECIEMESKLYFINKELINENIQNFEQFKKLINDFISSIYVLILRKGKYIFKLYLDKQSKMKENLKNNLPMVNLNLQLLCKSSFDYNRKQVKPIYLKHKKISQDQNIYQMLIKLGDQEKDRDLIQLQITNLDKINHLIGFIIEDVKYNREKLGEIQRLKRYLNEFIINPNGNDHKYLNLFSLKNQFDYFPF